VTNSALWVYRDDLSWLNAFGPINVYCISRHSSAQYLALSASTYRAHKQLCRNGQWLEVWRLNSHRCERLAQGVYDKK
jgi:hypothetical protein